MKKETLKNEDNIIEAKCTLDEKASSKIRNNVMKEYRQHFVLPGFRAGKVPDRVIKMRFKDKLEDEIKGMVFNDAVQEFKKEGFFFSVKPEFNLSIDDKEFSFDLSYALIPKFDLPDYSEYTVNTTPEAVKDEEIEEEIKNFLKNDAVYKPVEDDKKEAELEDQVILSATLYKDADKKEAIDSQATDFEVLLFENDSNKDFVSGIVGKKKNGKGSYTGKVNSYLTNIFSIPEGTEEVTIEYTLKELKALEYPELSDDYIKSSPGNYESVEAFKAEVVNGLEARKTHELKKNQEDEIVDKLIADTTIEITDAVKKKLTEKPAKEEGGEPEAPTKEEEESTLKEVKKECLIEAIAEEEGLSVSDEEVAAEKERFCNQFGPQYYEMMAARANDQMFYQNLVTNKVMDFLKNIALSNA